MSLVSRPGVIERIHMKVGDLVREVTRMTRPRCIGIVLEVDHTQTVMASGKKVPHPYLVMFDDGEFDWMKSGFLEQLNHNF
jgi:hypothetical protein